MPGMRSPKSAKDRPGEEKGMKEGRKGNVVLLRLSRQMEADFGAGHAHL